MMEKKLGDDVKHPVEMSASCRNPDFCFRVFSWVMLVSLTSFVSAAAAADSSCRKTCGGINIDYPLGIDPGCGSGAFTNFFRCDNSSVLNFVAPSGMYPVRSVDYSNKTLSLYDASMTTCNGGLVAGRNFTLDPAASKVFSLSPNPDLLLLNCATNATLVHSSQFNCNATASVCSAFKTCADYANSDPATLVTGCCALTQQSTSSIDLSLLKCAGYTSVHNYDPVTTDISKFTFFIDLAWTEAAPEAAQCALCGNSSGTCGFNSTNGFSCLCGNSNTTSVCPPALSKNSKARKWGIIGGTIGGAGVMILLIILVTTRCCSLDKAKRAAKEAFETFEFDMMDGMSEAPTRFSYKDLFAATGNFSDKLGQGGFGTVYKGALPSGQAVAVKKLEGSGQGQKQFQAEVSTIGNVHHFNLVRFFGYCFERSERLLVYEYLPNGSLDKYLFKRVDGEQKELTWPQRFAIALDIARGLAYLHEGCRKRIIHCDVKPENILLDENFSAKLSDFGLAKLVDRQEADAFTVVRGTRGYLAPEWFLSNTPITEKCDVYSFGMVLLELIGGRKNVDFKVSSAKYFFHVWVYDKIVSDDLSEIVDKHLSTSVDVDQVMLLAKLALTCVQEDPLQRPTMSKAVQVLEGVSELQLPGPPFRRLDSENIGMCQTIEAPLSLGSWSYPSGR